MKAVLVFICLLFSCPAFAEYEATPAKGVAMHGRPRYGWNFKNFDYANPDAPKGGTLQDYAYREAPYVFYRNGLYYFLWSVDDTGSPNYHVAYGTSDSPLGPIKVADQPIVLIQDPDKEIYGPAHNAVLNLPGTDEWRIVYHRINKWYLKNGPGVHREVCIDRLEFNPDGTIKPVVPTL